MSFTHVTTPEKLYYDIQVSNLENTNVEAPILNFVETRNNPFLYESDQYLMSIIRFSLDTPNLPVFIPTIQSNQSDVNLTIYSVSLTYNNGVTDFIQQTYIEYIPQNLIIATPPPTSTTPDGLQYNLTGYYNTYNYQYFIYLINNAFITCYNDLNTQVTTAGSVLPSAYHPTISWDTQNNTAIIYCDLDGYSTGLSTPIKIYFNTPLAGLFSSFPVLINSLSSTNGLNAQLITDSYSQSNTIGFPPYSPVYEAIQVFQEFSTISIWCPITAIVFTSNTLPIISNQVSTPIIYNNGSIQGSNGNNALITQVITDFISSDGMYKPILIYEPSAQYRYIQLISNRPLSTFDLQVFWKDRTGQLIPFRLASGCTATIKVLFTKKGTIGTGISPK